MSKRSNQPQIKFRVCVQEPDVFFKTTVTSSAFSSQAFAKYIAVNINWKIGNILSQTSLCRRELYNKRIESDGLCCC